jgi:FkbM family methyltransferase
MDLELDDHIQFRAFMDGGFDFMPVIIAKYLCSGKTYIDVGANVGTTCLPVAKTGIKTLAIEASPHILGKLYRNLSLNPGLDLMVLGVALGDVDNEIIQMYLPGGGNLGAASLYKDWNNNQKDTRIENNTCLCWIQF